MNAYESASPSPPPTNARNTDSSRTRLRMRPSPNPSVFNTASSLVRSRIACAIVLPATSRIVNIAIATIHIMILPMSPIWLAQSETNAFSVLVFVSDGELANIASIFAAISGARSGFAIVKTYQLYRSLKPLADRPAEFLRRIKPDDDACPIGKPGFLLFVRQLVLFRINAEPALGFDG